MTAEGAALPAVARMAHAVIRRCSKGIEFLMSERNALPARPRADEMSMLRVLCRRRTLANMGGDPWERVV